MRVYTLRKICYNMVKDLNSRRGDRVNVGDKIKVALEYRRMTVQELAFKMGYNSPSALYNKFKRANFSEEDLKQICKVLNCEYEVMIRLPDINREI